MGESATQPVVELGGVQPGSGEAPAAAECCEAPLPPPPPPPPGPIYGCENSTLEGTKLALHKTTTPQTSHPTGQESRSPGHLAARSVTVMCTTKPKGDKACKRT